MGDCSSLGICMSLVDSWAVGGFLEELSSKSPTPGGGSAVAVMGAMAAALVSMVANLTLGKKGYEDVAEEMLALVQAADQSRVRLLSLVEADISAFDEVMKAYAMDKGSDQEKAVRSAAIQAGLKSATMVPLACAKICREIIDFSERAAEIGNRNVVTDAGVAVLAAHAGLKSAFLNVRVNTSSIQDRAFVEEAMRKIESLSSGVDLKVDKVYQRVIERL